MPRTSMVSLVLPFIVTACAEPKPGDESPISCAPDCDTAFVLRGAHGVGHQVVQSGDLTLKAWYPTNSPDAAIDYEVRLKLPGWPAEPTTIHGEATRNAPVADGGPYPLVVLSHGFSGNPEWYRTLVEHLASHGFFVLAPEHTESDWFTDVVPATFSRPAEVSAAIDFAGAGAFAGAIDLEHVAVVGHSYGGYTALAVAGGRFDLDDLEERCEGVEDEFTAAYFCTTFLEQREALSAPPVLSDDRVDAIVSLAGDAYLFGSDGLADITIPTLAIGGTVDSGTPWTWGAALTYDDVGSAERMLVGLQGGEHFLPMADCADMPWTAALPEFERGYICRDPAWEKRAGLDVIHHFTTAFLRAHLEQDPTAHEALDVSLYEDAAMLEVLR